MRTVATATERMIEPEMSPYLADVLGALRTGNDNHSLHAMQPEPGPAAELDCLRGRLAPEVLEAAERRAVAARVGADRVLLQWGVIDEAAYIEHFAAHTGLEVESFAAVGRADCPLSDAQLLAAASVGMLYLRDARGLIGVIAPQHYVSRHIALAVAQNPAARPRIRLTTTADFHGFLAQHAGAAIAHQATDGLKIHDPDLSAAPQQSPAAEPNLRQIWRQRLRTGAIMTGLVATILLMPVLLLDVISGLAAFWFLIFSMLRLMASLVPRQTLPRLSRLADDQLPVYSIIVALYREAASLPALLHAIRALDYPAEKLDLILAIEPDDLETHAAIARLRPHVDFQVVIATATGPRTKPKALNCALPFARGTFVAIYDAEDRPEPGQLRAALDAFRSHDDTVVCVQASLCIDNVSDSLLSRMFAAEYAGQFDFFLPGAAALRLPLPLGGSSNHFRADVLRRVHGWDPYNVTEDADLGLRLARFGYRSVTFVSTTLEEAPAQFAPWLRQRSRWMKGWMRLDKNRKLLRYYILLIGIFSA